MSLHINILDIEVVVFRNSVFVNVTKMHENNFDILLRTIKYLKYGTMYYIIEYEFITVTVDRTNCTWVEYKLRFHIVAIASVADQLACGLG